MGAMETSDKGSQNKLDMTLDDLIKADRQKDTLRTVQKAPEFKRRSWSPFKTTQPRDVTIDEGVSRNNGYCVTASQLPPNTTARDVRQLFSRVGIVADVQLHPGGGFARIFFSSYRAATAAVEELDQLRFNGSYLSVNKESVRNNHSMDKYRGGEWFGAYPNNAYSPVIVPNIQSGVPYPPGLRKYPQPYSLPRSYIYERSGSEDRRTVLVSNVPKYLTKQEIQDAFGCVGTILKTEFLLNDKQEQTSRVAVTYAAAPAAIAAVHRYHGGELNGNAIKVFLE